MLKRLLVIIIPVILITIFSYYLDKSGQVMTIHFIDVGQGDSIFIDFGDYEILNDAGGNMAGLTVANYIKPFVDGNVELIIATHIHEDHIGGLDTILSTYQVDKIIDSGDIADTITYEDYFNAAINETNAIFIPDEDMNFDLGRGANFKVIETGDDNKNVNNNSVITLIDYMDVEVLLTGDMESSVEKKNLNKFTDVEILKAGHHGSKTASCQEFLDIVKPETIIISCGARNRYKHPHKESISRFLNIGAEVYSTFKSETIVVTTDGKSYNLNTSSLLTLDDAN